MEGGIDVLGLHARLDGSTARRQKAEGLASKDRLKNEKISTENMQCAKQKRKSGTAGRCIGARSHFYSPAFTPPKL